MVLQKCMEAEMQSEPEKIRQLPEQSKTEGDTFPVPRDTIEQHPMLGTKGIDSQKAARWFIKHPNYHITPLQLSEYCHISHASAKKICSRWFDRGWLQQSLQNHYEYQQKITASDLETLAKLETIKLHNLRLIVPFQSGDRRAMPPLRGTAKSFSDGETKTTSSHAMLGSRGTTELPSDSRQNVYIKTPERILETYDMQGNPQARIKIFRHPKELEITIACSKNPLDVIAFERTIGYIEGAGYCLSGARFYLLEINVDIEGLQIDGAQSIKLFDFRNCIQRYYNKKGKLRKEFILRGNIPLEEVMAVMRGEQTLGTNVLSIELEKTKKELEKVKEHLTKSSDQYRRFVKFNEDNQKLKQENERLKKRNGELKQQLEQQNPVQQHAEGGAVRDDSMFG